MSRVRVLEGVRPVDWALAGALTALGVGLMLENVAMSDSDVVAAIASGSMVHPMSSHSAAMVPVFALATLPVLWWRRNLLVVIGIALVAMAVHDLAFGWVTRCGAGLPLAFVLAFLGAYSLERVAAWACLLTTTLLTALVLVVDATTGLQPLILAVPVLLIVFGVGRAARHRVEMGRSLVARNDELKQLRDHRVALEVADDRARLAQELDGLLQQRLTRLEAVAESGRQAAPRDPAQAQGLFAAIEQDSRATLEAMRDLVSVLRGSDVALAPTPSMAHLDALLARHARSDSRLTVSGDARSLPATVELSAYRIVEHLVAALADRPGSGVRVGVHFDEDTLEIVVHGPVGRAADLRAAAARAKERARLLGGSLEVRVTRGTADAVALLPVTG